MFSSTTIKPHSVHPKYVKKQPFILLLLNVFKKQRIDVTTTLCTSPDPRSWFTRKSINPTREIFVNSFKNHGILLLTKKKKYIFLVKANQRDSFNLFSVKRISSRNINENKYKIWLLELVRESDLINLFQTKKLEEYNQPHICLTYGNRP